MRILLAAAALTTLALAPLSAQTAVKWTVQGARSLTVTPGSITDVRIDAQVENGWRVYSLAQPNPGPHAMTITLLPGSRTTFAGDIVSPPAVARFDSSFKVMAETYTGKGSFVIPLRASMEEGITSSTIKITYQACTARFCLPPRNELIQLTFKIKQGE